MQIYPKLEDISSSFAGILLDAYGVFWGGNSIGLLPGAKQAMEEMIKSGKTVGILSNTTQLSYKEMDKLQLHGLNQGVHYHFMITSGDVSKQLFMDKNVPFQTPNMKFWLFGGVHPHFPTHIDIFKETGYALTEDIKEADFIYISVPHVEGRDYTDPEIHRHAIQKIIDTKLPMVCTNPDRLAHEGNPPRAVVRQGFIAAIYEEYGGEVFYIGKPSTRMYEKAMHHFHPFQITSPEQVLMVGDTPETDIRGARLFGMPAALIMRTGTLADRISQHGIDQVLQELPAHDTPHFFIESLGN